MRILDLDALERASVQHEPCDFVIVPEFIRAEAIEAINRDYPPIQAPGNFEPEALAYGAAFSEMLAELNSPIVKSKFAEKFGIDLDGLPLQMTIRKFCETSDGNVHNDSRGKIVTALIYFNKEWVHAGGKLRLLNTPGNIEDYAAEVTPVGGTLIAFRRSERSYHGFKPCNGERRSLQMYWVKPKRAERGEEKRVGLRRMIKRILKKRRR